MQRFLKDPQAVLDYGFDWRALGWLENGEVIAESTWTITPPDELVEDSTPTNDDGATTVWLAGGTPGRTYRVTNHIRTSASRRDDRSFTVEVRNR